MKVTGIIAEFNPLHNGHVFIINRARELLPDSVLVIALSGNFCQRGEPACRDKYTRAGWCLSAGADLVLELPAVFSLQSADYFAQGSISLLNLSGAEHLVFGSESGKIDDIVTAAATTLRENSDFSEEVSQIMDNGLSYPNAYAHAFQDQSLTLEPNNILAIAYLRSIFKHGYTIKPVTVKRTGCGYYDEMKMGTVASATAIRKKLGQGKKNDVASFVPDYVLKDLPNKTKDAWSTIFLLLRYRLLYARYDLPEGLDRLWLKHIHENDFQSFFRAITSKRYTQSRLKREIICSLLGITRSDLTQFNKKGSRYLKPLAFTVRGRELLSSLKKKNMVITNYQQIKKVNTKTLSGRMLGFDLAADDLYSLLIGKQCRSYTKAKPVREIR